MNYQKIYDQIIDRAKNSNRKRLKNNHPNYQYFEKHHIIPRCMDGTDEKTNLVFLTAREHFLVHHLLVRIYPTNSKIVFAFHRMCFSSNNGLRNIKLSSTTYKEVRELHANSMSENLIGRIFQQSTIDKMVEHHAKRNHQTKQEIVKKINFSKKEKFKSGEIVIWNKNKKRDKNIICNHCGKIGIKSNINRWHNDNCKLNPLITNEQLIKRNKTRNVKKYKAIIAIDFDETIADSEFPKIIGLRYQAQYFINKLYEEDFYIIINTCRTGLHLDQAVDFLNKEKINFHLANQNHKGLKKYFDVDCRKISFDISVDDKNLDTLLDSTNLNWVNIYNNIHKITSQPTFKSILRLLD